MAQARSRRSGSTSLFGLGSSPSAPRSLLSGKVERFRGATQMKSPDVDVLSSNSEGLKTGRVVPIHPTIAKVPSGWVRRGMWNALTRSRPISDPIPEPILTSRGLIDRDAAMTAIHFPESMPEVGRARKRLVYDEFFRLELALALNKRLREQRQVGIVHPGAGRLSERFIGGLPYELTDAQVRAIDEIIDDLRTNYPMQRLLQGEVGSGKTVVAVATLLIAVEGGFQAAVMAPTEVLSVQHYLGIRDLLDDAGMAPPDAGPAAALGMDSLFAPAGQDDARAGAPRPPHGVPGGGQLRNGCHENRRPERGSRMARSTSSSERTPSSRKRSISGLSAWR